MKHATFIYAINNIQKLVRPAQLVEQLNGNPEVGDLSPLSNHLIFKCHGIHDDFLYEPDECKTLNITISGYAIKIIIKLLHHNKTCDFHTCN